ncbi:hypothetical protein GIHI108528_06620 [Gillisia hiemivivida]
MVSKQEVNWNVLNHKLIINSVLIAHLQLEFLRIALIFINLEQTFYYER